jgi:hypothetical protein
VEAILRRVQEERGALGGFLGQAAWMEIVDQTLEIAFDAKHAFFKEKVESRENILYLGDVAHGVAGRRLQVKAVVAAASAPGAASLAGAGARRAPAGESEETRKKRLHEEALKEPVVRNLLETFGGQIVDVEST